jgi:hypothetical protein
VGDLYKERRSNAGNKVLDKEFKASFGMAYLSLILLHELTHHVIEDWRVSTDGVFTYNKEDENLCEYTAFTLTEAIIDKFNIGFLSRIRQLL